MTNSKYRIGVMKSLKGKVLIPTEIADKTGIVRNHISNTLRDLKDKGLVECLNPKDKKGRLYRLTDKGNNIVEKLKSKDA